MKSRNEKALITFHVCWIHSSVAAAASVAASFPQILVLRWFNSVFLKVKSAASTTAGSHTYLVLKESSQGNYTGASFLHIDTQVRNVFCLNIATVHLYQRGFKSKQNWAVCLILIAVYLNNSRLLLFFFYRTSAGTENCLFRECRHPGNKDYIIIVIIILWGIRDLSQPVSAALQKKVSQHSVRESIV